MKTAYVIVRNEQGNDIPANVFVYEKESMAMEHLKQIKRYAEYKNALIEAYLAFAFPFVSFIDDAENKQYTDTMFRVRVK